ncbi:MAG TPA: energy transducer TonB [Saprospiraceae bacterium]|nr:energy transducer TonB [Saprospiraceae bacterium]HPI06322.1 energy transducer TonB [Saprospiraceae bacterium]
MATPLSPVSYRDALDIVFARRNRAYGAYALRREYPVNLGKALATGLLLIGFFVVLPRLLNAFSGLVPEKTVLYDSEIVLSQPPDVDVPPPTPPPPPPTPPPPVRATVRFVPPVVVENDKAPDEPPPAVMDVLEDPGAVGAVSQAGIIDAPPSDIDPDDFGTVIVTQVKKEDETYDTYGVNKMPGFPGGERDLMTYLGKNIEYPTLAKEANIEGIVVLGFIVGKDGSINDVKILKDIGGGCGKEALRVVSNMPAWVPGEANGHAVKVRFTLPVRFRLQ